MKESQQSSTLAQIKEEEKEEDTNKQPAAKRKRGQPKIQTKYEESPKEEPKTEGNLDLLATFLVFVMHGMTNAVTQPNACLWRFATYCFTWT